MRMSQSSARPKPSAEAYPSMAPISGLDRRSCSGPPSPAHGKYGSASGNASRCAPPQKLPLAPVITIARVSSSRSASASARASARAPSGVRALRVSGELRMIVVTGGRRVERISPPA
jgi:hypothetical protein